MNGSRWSLRAMMLCFVALLATAIVQREAPGTKEPRVHREPSSSLRRKGRVEFALPTTAGGRPRTDGCAPTPPTETTAPRDAWSWVRAILDRHSEEEFLAGFPVSDADFDELPSDEALAAATDWLAWLDLLDAQASPGRRRFVAQALSRARHLGDEAPQEPGAESLFQARVGRLLRSEQDAETRARLLAAVDTWEVREYDPTFLEAVRERLADSNESLDVRQRAIEVLDEPAVSGDLRSFEAIAAIFDGPHDDLQLRALARACSLLKSQGVPPGDRDRFREGLFLAMESIPDSEYSDWTASCFADNLVDDPPSLARAIAGKGMTLRAAASYALEKGAAVAGPEVTSALIEAARGTGTASYRRSAVEALWRVAEGPEPDASRAREAIQSVALVDEDAELRGFASFALQGIELASESDGNPEGGE